MDYCTLCQELMHPGEAAARYYFPVTPERISRGHTTCIRTLQERAAAPVNAPVIVE